MDILLETRFLCFILMILLTRVVGQTTEESSGEYLQKVMIELQELNVQPPINVHDRFVTNVEYKNSVYENKDNGVNVPDRASGNTQKKVEQSQDQNLQLYGIPPSDKIDLKHAASEIAPQYYQHAPTITKMREPEALGFTRAELAALYKSALEKGSAISLSSLTNSLASGATPHITGTHVEFPVKKPLYQYYFFPLKTFMSELKKENGYKTIPAPILENTEATETSQTQLASPLFVAISTFVSMALIFMMGVLFLPKLSQYGILHARGIQDDFLHLSNIVMNAIERHNILEKFADHRSDYSRLRVTRRIKGKRRKRRTSTITSKWSPVNKYSC